MTPPPAPEPNEPDASRPCGAATAFHLLAGKWTLAVLHHLHTCDDPIRFAELRRRLAPVTTSELTKTLRHLEASGLVARTVYAEVPARVEYRCTDDGWSLKPILDALAAWLDAGGRHRTDRAPDLSAPQRKK